MLFSKYSKCRGKKKPPHQAVFSGFAGTRFYFYVHRPLLHRLGVGIAKVKVAGKEEVGHERVRQVLGKYRGMTITPTRNAWQAIS
jgi:hypothetical protein